MDLPQIRDIFNNRQIMVCFNGPIHAALIEEIGRALRDYLQQQHTTPGAVADIFAVYIEMAQNIRHYAQTHEQVEDAGQATILIARQGDHYLISAGNVVTTADGAALVAMVDRLAEMDAAQLKAAYKAQLRRPRTELAGSAGLGLIDIARRSTAALHAGVQPLDPQRSLFSLRVIL